jgi:hypothetical protein
MCLVSTKTVLVATLYFCTEGHLSVTLYVRHELTSINLPDVLRDPFALRDIVHTVVGCNVILCFSECLQIFKILYVCIFFSVILVVIFSILWVVTDKEGVI